MSAINSQEHNEPCDGCGTETPHSVRIEIIEESRKKENRQFSREPYRIATCRYCGETTKTRMNNA